MRRVTVIATLVALLVIALPMSAALAAPAPAADGSVVVLAVDDEPAGPEPALRTDEDNAARTLAGYEDPEVPFTWGAAWILAFAGLVGVVLLGGLYQLLVRGPAQRQDS
jgi:hypothetical protein